MAIKLSDLTAANLTKLSRLIGQKEKLQTQLVALEAKINAIGGTDIGSREVAKPGRKKGRRGPKPGAKPGKLKETVLAALHATEGLTIKELATKLKVKSNNLYSWFYTTGKKVAGLKKSAAGKYTYSGAK